MLKKLTDILKVLETHYHTYEISLTRGQWKEFDLPEVEVGTSKVPVSSGYIDHIIFSSVDFAIEMLTLALSLFILIQQPRGRG